MTRLQRYSLGTLLGFAFIQLIPYGKDHHNPPVGREPRWSSNEAKQLARAVCFDCHSHETEWPWYANVAPASWLVAWDVSSGRKKLNFSDWDHPGYDVDEAAQQLREFEMPPFYYRALHPEAQLSGNQRQKLLAALETVIRSPNRTRATGETAHSASFSAPPDTRGRLPRR